MYEIHRRFQFPNWKQQSKEKHEEMFSQLKAMTPESEHLVTFSINEKYFKEEDYESEIEAFIVKLK